jgi:hypothetical protein
MSRLVIVPQESHEAMGAELLPRLAAIAREVNADNIAGIIGAQGVSLLESSAARTDGTLLLWAGNGDGYAVAWQGGDKDLVERARADSGEGLIARVFGGGRSETAAAEELELSEWSNLPALFPGSIAALAASPVHVFGNCIAALSIISSSSSVDRLPPPSETAPLLARLIEDRLIRMSIGLESA